MALFGTANGKRQWHLRERNIRHRAFVSHIPTDCDAFNEVPGVAPMQWCRHATYPPPHLPSHLPYGTSNRFCQPTSRIIELRGQPVHVAESHVEQALVSGILPAS
jgi:hypothetical protein